MRGKAVNEEGGWKRKRKGRRGEMRKERGRKESKSTNERRERGDEER